MNKKNIRGLDELEGYDWNEGHPDHEGDMAVSQLHRIVEMAAMLLDIIGENDDLPGWIQYKFTRAYSDLNDAFGYIESKSHDMEEMYDDFEEFEEDELEDYEDKFEELEEDDDDLTEGKKKNKGLWANINARRKAGKRKKRPGEKGYPKTLNIESNARHILRSMIRESLKNKFVR
jgi:hypothetical protein